jgi:hypothetical protein
MASSHRFSYYTRERIQRPTNYFGRGENNKRRKKMDWIEHTNKVIGTVLEDDPQLIVNVLLDAFRLGMSGDEIAGAVAYSAALRIAQFNVHNEFTDWDAALHTFTFANAVHQSLKRISAYMSHESQSQSPATSIQLHELLRGIFDAAMQVYLNRFLNIPPAPILNPNVNSNITNIEHYAIEEKLSTLLDKQQQVDEAAQLVADYYGRPHTGNRYNNRKPEPQLEQEKQHILMDLIGRLLLREDRSFHLIQMIESAHKQCSTKIPPISGIYNLIAI